MYQLLLSQGCHAGQLLALCVFEQSTAADAAHSLTEIHSPYGYGESSPLISEYALAAVALAMARATDSR